jgi:hypothetical protein
VVLILPGVLFARVLMQVSLMNWAGGPKHG